MTFGQHIRTLRKHAGLTQGQLAAKLGFSTTWLSNIERGITLLPARHIPATAKLLGVTISGLVPIEMSVHSHVVSASRFEGVVAADTAIAIGDVEVGRGSYLGHHVVLDGSHGKIRIGKGVTIGHGVIIVTSFRGKGADVIIGVGSTIAPGATIYPPLRVPAESRVGFPSVGESRR